jgi:hypothetical protein
MPGVSGKMPAMTTTAKPRILILSGYDAGSHRRWREQLVASQPEFEWRSLFLAPRFFRWRIRGNALSWLDEPLLREPSGPAGGHFHGGPGGNKSLSSGFSHHAHPAVHA